MSLVYIKTNERRGGTVALVGLVSDSNCTYNSITAAINSGADEIRIINDEFNENIETTNQSLSLISEYEITGLLGQ